MLSATLRNPFPLRQVATVVGSVAMMILCSKLTIPIKPVPFTLQTMGVLLIAMTCSPVKAFLSLLAWISLAAAGFPVLAGNSVIGSIVNHPTAGYLVGMLIAVTVMSAAQFYGSGFFNRIFSKKSYQEHEPLNFSASIFVGTIGALITLAMGWMYLSQFLGSVAAWTHGVVPFLLPELLKIVAASFFVTTFHLGKVAR